MIAKLPKYLLFASLGLCLLTVVQVIIALLIGWTGYKDLSEDLLWNFWRFPVLAVPIAMLAIVTAALLGITRPASRSHAEAMTHCHACGYDMRGLPSRRCPECGTVLDAST